MLWSAQMLQAGLSPLAQRQTSPNIASRPAVQGSVTCSAHTLVSDRDLGCSTDAVKVL